MAHELVAVISLHNKSADVDHTKFNFEVCSEKNLTDSRFCLSFRGLI